MLILFLKGILLGIAISMPMGPISVLCIQRTLAHGIKIGLLTAIGSAFADGIFGTIAALGLTSLASYMNQAAFALHVIGGLFLAYLGFNLLLTHSKPMQPIAQPAAKPSHALISAFFLTLTNPVTIFSFMAFFAGIGLATQGQHDYPHVLSLICGLMLGSTLWEFSLSISMKSLLYRRLSDKIMQKLNMASGSILLGFAAISFIA